LNWPLEIGDAKIVWWLFWWLLVSTVAMCDELRGAGSEGASGTEDCCFQPWVKTPSEILINLRKAGLMLSVSSVDIVAAFAADTYATSVRVTRQGTREGRGTEMR